MIIALLEGDQTNENRQKSISQTAYLFITASLIQAVKRTKQNTAFWYEVMGQLDFK